MSYVRYRGVKKVNGKKIYGPWHTSYSHWQTAYAGAYREMKRKDESWDYVLIEAFQNHYKEFYEHYVVFIDREGVFGKKNGAILLDMDEAKGSLSKESIHRHGAYLSSDGSLIYIKNKKSKDSFGIPDDWHPFGL